MRDVVIVGASAAGLTAAETLRRDGYAGRITVVGDEPHAPYDRPPLSKQVMRGDWEPERTALRPEAKLGEIGAEWILGRAAAGLDPERREVRLDDGTSVSYDGLVIATGVRPRRLPFGHDLDGVHTLRSLDDALSLRDRLARTPRVVVVGAGFLGAEFAAVAAELGCSVDLIDALPAPLAGPLGLAIGERVAELHTARGVRFHGRTGVTALHGDGRVEAVELTGGERIAADLVLVAIGSEPAVEWLRGSGLPLRDGVLCDEYCAAAPGVVAAGDVASWIHPRYGRMRVEHRMNAIEQGTAAARTLLGGAEPFAPVPFFWTDQFDVKIQGYGRPSGADEFVVIEGDVREGPFAGEFRWDGGVMAGVAWNLPRAARALRAVVAEPQPVRP